MARARLVIAPAVVEESLIQPHTADFDVSDALAVIVTLLTQTELARAVGVSQQCVFA